MILDENGLQIDTFDEIVEELYSAIGVALSLNPEQIDKMRSSVKSTLGQLARMLAEREAALQELVLAVYDTLSWNTEGANLDRVVRLLGVVRRAPLDATVTGDVTGTALHVIPGGTIFQYGVTGSTWQVVGDTALDAGGEGSVTLEALTTGAAVPVNVGFDFVGELTGTVPPPGDTHRLTFTGFGLGAPVDIDATVTSPFGLDSVLRALAVELEAESDTGGSIEGVVFTTRVFGSGEAATIQIWTNPALATGTIVYTYIGVLPPGIAPSMSIDPSTIWSILNDADVDTFVALAQPVVGSAVEIDAPLRARSAIEAFRRGQGPQAATRAAVSQVTGVTYVAVWESQVLDACDVDADGIPGRAINVVVEGGDDDEVAYAIFISRAGGAETYADPGPTFVEVEVLTSIDTPVTIRYNRVESVDIWMDVEITTSTAEPPPAPPDVESVAAAILLEAATTLFQVGADVLPWQLEGRVFAASLPGIDDVRVELSYDDGVLDPYTRAKRAITLRQRAVADAARITVTQV